MKTRTMWITMAVAAILVLMAGAAGALQSPSAPEAVVANKINYQGQLTTPGGLPLSGVFPMRFQIYDDPGGGALLWDSGVMGVDVDHGLFNAELWVEPAAFNGRGLWLRIWVDGEWLTPRQELSPVPYALSLRPGAEVEADAPTNWVFRATNTNSFATGSAIWGAAATGSAIYGNSAGGYGLYGYSEVGNAVVGTSVDKTAGVFHSDEGYGIRVSTNGTNHWDHGGYFSANWGYGIYATSNQSPGVRAEAGDISGAWQPGGQVGVVGIGEDRGVYGSSHDGPGVDGVSVTDSGVYGETESNDANTAAGVWGQKWSEEGLAVRGLKYGTFGIGIQGSNNGTTGSAIAADSTNYYGLYSRTDRGDNNYGLFTPDNIYSLNYNLAGAVMQVAQNGGTEALEAGDVVVFSGLAAPLEKDGSPLVQVSRATSANSSAVAGVVYSGFNIKAVDGTWQPDGHGTEDNAQVTLEGPVKPGEYLLLVVQGPAQVKASALSGAIRPGDLLSSAGEAGRAAKATRLSLEGVEIAAPGTVFGKALEPLDADRGLIYVFVTLQ